MSVTITHAKVVLENHNVHTNGLALGVLSRLWWQRGHPCSLKRMRGVSARDVFHDRHGITLQEETMRADRGVLAGWPLHGCSAGGIGLRLLLQQGRQRVQWALFTLLFRRARLLLPVRLVRWVASKACRAPRSAVALWRLSRKP